MPDPFSLTSLADLADGVILFIQAQANNVTFQQDNARPHVARVVRDYLTQQNVDLLPWPSISQTIDVK
jgi:hypothetical protein